MQRSGKSPENRHNDFETNINEMLTAIPWTAGKASKTLYEGSMIGLYDDSAIELDSEETILTGVGMELESAREAKATRVYSQGEPQRDAKSK